MKMIHLVISDVTLTGRPSNVLVANSSPSWKLIAFSPAFVITVMVHWSPEMAICWTSLEDAESATAAFLMFSGLTPAKCDLLQYKLIAIILC